jgi:pyrimidine-nucleoside phosphorylase
MTTSHIPTLISRKRDGEELSAAEIRGLIDGFSSGKVPDYQMSAFAMAVLFKGMSPAETAALTRAMMESGEHMKHPVGAPVIDKHSTGGIGDKVSLVLAPLLACTGARVPMVSGRGLGITGGTLDKLESIPGFNVHLTLEQATAQLEEIGVVMMGQTDQFCPADRKLYALRDVTGTVPSIPLITASIMSKKLAESLDRLVLDVKFGHGAFMKSKKQATALAKAMEAVGREMGVQVEAVLNPMDQPTGRAVGNALEVAEALDCLAGEGPDDLLEAVIVLAEKITEATEKDLLKLIKSGAAMEKFQVLVSAQGGDPADLPRITEIHAAPVIRELPAPDTGTVAKLRADLIGQAAVELGAGRCRADDSIDPAVGFDRLAKVGEEVHQGKPIARIHARNLIDFEIAEAMFDRALKIDPIDP